jgi:redox-sensitive bicupin YhaK (pirin superfamily)
MIIEVRPAVDRLETRADGKLSRHSFSYGPHYEPTNTRFGCLITHNDDLLGVGAGFPEHPHRDIEIVTWVVSGALEHTDSSGGSAILRPGVVGRLSAGGGVHHSERNASAGETRYIQMWLLPDAEGLPSYESADVSQALESHQFVAVASGVDQVAPGGRPAAVTVRCNATLFVARLPAGSSATIPSAPLLHIFVARGRVLLTADQEQEELLSDDAVRLTGAVDVRVEATADAEVLVWAMAGEVGSPRAL